MKKGDPYTCTHCGGLFRRGREDAVAEAEFEENFPECDDPVIICDDCWKKLGFDQIKVSGNQ
jgi:hypothetical protein